jgi:ribosome biogenesis GTPase / thiamine phosphate phosphatase
LEGGFVHAFNNLLVICDVRCQHLVAAMRRMMGRLRRKNPREKDLTSRVFSGDYDQDEVQTPHRFSKKIKRAQQEKIERTAILRADKEVLSGDLESLPVGEVTQVFSLFCDIDTPVGVRRCVTRKTLSKISATSIVVGDLVRFRETGRHDESGIEEAVIEQVLPRKTILTRAGSFNNSLQKPIVANAGQMLIVTSLVMPRVKWGLVDRMLIAAQSGGLVPIVCLNKIDLAETTDAGRKAFPEAQEVLGLYQTMGVATLQTSAEARVGLEQLIQILAGKNTVLAGHSGVGKSSLITAAQASLIIRVGDVSEYTEKGRHTTSSARRYPLEVGGFVIDTPGVKQFGLWDVTEDNLIEYFPDIENETAPDWRRESYERILESLRGE